MNLQKIIIDAAGGFTAGLAVGLAGMPERYTEKLEVIELVPEKDRGGISDNRLKSLRKNLKLAKFSIPFVAGVGYSYLAGLIESTLQNNTDFNLPTRVAVSIPSAYIGRFIGSRIRRARTKKGLNLQKNIIRALQDSENMDKYLLPEAKRKIVEEAFSEVEKRILSEEPEEAFQELEKGPLKIIYDALASEPSPCNGLLICWSLTQHKRLAERASLQRDITKFYELPYEEKVGRAEVVDLTAIGEVKVPKAKVFTRERNDFYVQTCEWRNLKMVSDDKTGAVKVEGKRPKIEVSEREVWTGDYKALAEFVMKERHDYSVFLMRAPLELNENLREQAVTSIFLEYFAKENLKKS